MSRKAKPVRRSKAKKKVKKKSKKLWGLEVRTFSRGARQYMDQDYVKDLSDDDKRWLSDFNETYYGNKFPRASKPGKKTNLFDKAGVPRTEIFDQTNARNRDIHTTGYKINAEVNPYDAKDNYQRPSLFDLDRPSTEDPLIDYLDFKNLVEKLMSEGYTLDDARAKAISILGFD